MPTVNSFFASLPRELRNEIYKLASTSDFEQFHIDRPRPRRRQDCQIYPFSPSSELLTAQLQVTARETPQVHTQSPATPTRNANVPELPLANLSGRATMAGDRRSAPDLRQSGNDFEFWVASVLQDFVNAHGLVRANITCINVHFVFHPRARSRTTLSSTPDPSCEYRRSCRYIATARLAVLEAVRGQ